MASAEIHAVKTVSGNQPAIKAKKEEALQTNTANGIPVMVASDNGLQEWDQVTITNGIAGFLKQTFMNLATTGAANNTNYGSAPYQPSGYFLYTDGPIGDGITYYETGVGDSIFRGQIGPNQSLTTGGPGGGPVADGQQYGLTKDTDGHYYVDLNKTGAAAIVVITSLDPYWDSTRGVQFQVLPAALQVGGA